MSKLRFLLVVLWLGRLIAPRLGAGEFALDVASPTLDRWLYPFNFEPATRPVAPTFASFDPRFDTRDAQFFLGWNTEALVTTNRSPRNYLLKRVRLTLTVTADKAFVYDPTLDSVFTYMTNQPGYVPDADAGRPAELYGVAFRRGFTAATFAETSSYGPLGSIRSDTISIGTRNAYPMMFDPNGAPVDVSNNVGQHNAAWTHASFEVRPWAVGLTTNAAPGELVPEDSRFTFDMDLTDPLTVGYLQQALDSGRLRLMVNSLSPAVQITPGGTGGGGVGNYPQWSTRKNLLYDAPRLEVVGVEISDADTDHDGLPDDWERFYFGDLKPTAEGDSDGDGQTNRAEYLAGTDPSNRASAFGILASKYDPDGNAVLRFSSAPSRTYRIEISSDLVSWGNALGKLSYPEVGLAQWTEENLRGGPGIRPRAFFRVVVE